MKFKNLLPISAMLLVVLMAGCSKDPGASVNSISQRNNKSGLASMTVPGVNLGLAGEFVILSKAGITDVYKSDVTGDVGSSPITGAAILLTCPEVTGAIYSVDAAGPLPSRITNPTRLTTAVSDMEAAYTDASGRANPDFVNLGAGNIGGLTLTPGVYKWTTALQIPTDITISGTPNDVFIFQVDGALNVSNAVKMNLTGGVLAQNIYWVTAGSVTCGTTSHIEGNILGKTDINLMTGASINGRLLSQTAVSLQMNKVGIVIVNVPVIVLPTIISSDPTNNAIDVANNKVISFTFSKPMDPISINTSTVTLFQGLNPVSGTVAYTGSSATFTPSTVLADGVIYTATVTTGVKDVDGNALAVNTVQNFTTFIGTVYGPATVNLRTAGNFEILTKTGVTDVYQSAIFGDVGASPITGRALLISCAEVTGNVYSVDAEGPLPCRLTNPVMLSTAVSDMETAYTDAAGRPNPDFFNLGAGNIGGLTLTPGLYKWTTGLLIPTDVTLSGGPNDIYILQVAGIVTMSSAMKITLTGGVQAKNIFWVVAGAVNIGTTSHFEGNILAQTAINLMTGASINGRLLAQTAVNLQMNTANKPQ